MVVHAAVAHGLKSTSSAFSDTDEICPHGAVRPPARVHASREGWDAVKTWLDTHEAVDPIRVSADSDGPRILLSPGDFHRLYVATGRRILLPNDDGQIGIRDLGCDVVAYCVVPQ